MKLLFTLCAFAISTVAFADDLPHDGAACPDLSGTYLMEESDQRITLKSFHDDSGVPVLAIDAGQGPVNYPLDGKKVDMGDGFDLVTLCHGGVVYDYYHYYDVTFQEVTWSLDMDRNFIYTVTSDGETSKMRGVRQPE